MRRTSYNGGITVFLSGVFLSLIIFSCSIVDITRIHIAKLQAETAIRNGAISVLASYDTAIVNEYGIFSRDINESLMTDSIMEYVNTTLKPEVITTSNKLINQSNNNFFDLYDYDVEITDINILNNLAGENGIQYVKEEILHFMKYRAPLLLIEPFLEKLEVIQKASKTSKLIKEKNSLVNVVQTIEEKFIELEKLVDGIIVNSDEVSNKLYTNYVKRLYMGTNHNIYSQDEIPDENIRDKLNKNVHVIKNDINTYQSNISDIQIIIDELINKYRHHKKIEQEKESLIIEQNTYSNEHNVDKYEEISDNIDIKTEQITNSWNQIKEYSNKVDDIYKGIDTSLLNIENLTQEYNTEVAYGEKRNDVYGYKGINEKAKEIIKSIKNDSEYIGKEIENFYIEANNNKSDYIDSTYEGVLKEVQDIEKKLAINNRVSMSLINNIVAMEQGIDNNITILNSIENSIINLRPNTNKLIAYYFSKNIKTNEDLILVKELLENNNLLKIDNKEVIANIPIKNSLYNEVIKILTFIENKLSGYDRNFRFNYSNMDSESSISKKTVKDYIKGANKIIESDFDNKYYSEVREINSDFLPSCYTSNNLYTSSKITIDDKSEESANNYLNALDIFSTKIGNLQENIYINEYILGIYKNASEKYIEEPLTINNYNKNEHYLDYEVEYIIGGHKNQNKNLQTVLSIIFGIRVAANIIHIISNGEKRTFITSVANAIAGWWTLGIGAIILTITLTLLWAIVESLVDISILISGGKVPFIKTSNTWYTSLKGNWEEIIDTYVNQLTAILENNINSISDKTQKLLIDLEHILNEESRNYLEQEISNIYYDSNSMVQSTCDEIKSIIDNAVNKAYEQIVRGEKINITISDYFAIGSYPYKILEKIINDIENQSNNLKDKPLSTIINSKEKMIKKYKVEIDLLQSNIKNESEKIIHINIKKTFDEINNTIIVCEEEGKELGTDILKTKTTKLKDNINKKLNEDMEDTINNRDNKLKELVPSFSYNDYLRLILLTKDEKIKLYRILDLIQLNSRHKANNNSIILKDYITDYEVKAKVSIKYIFFNLPFMPREAKDISNVRYSFPISVNVGY